MAWLFFKLKSMQKYIVIPVMITGKASKTYKAGDIVDADMLASSVDELVKGGYIKAINSAPAPVAAPAPTPAPVAISEMPQKFDNTPVSKVSNAFTPTTPKKAKK
jgi:hypothetical protein